MNDRLPRKLAAILYADVAEYSRLTGEDEDSTHLALSEFLDLISRLLSPWEDKLCIMQETRCWPGLVLGMSYYALRDRL